MTKTQQKNRKDKKAMKRNRGHDSRRDHLADSGMGRDVPRRRLNREPLVAENLSRQIPPFRFGIETATDALRLALGDDALHEFKKLNRAITLNWHTLDEQKPDWDSLCAQAAGLAGKIGHTDAATLLRFLAQVVEDGFMGSTP